MRIAICDDNSMDLKAMREVFRRVAPAYTLDSFSDSRKLLDTIAGGTSYDLLFLDILMPGITGMELAREVGRIAPDMPVVFLTDSDAYAMMLCYRDLIALRKANPWLYNSAVAGEVLEGSAIAAGFTEDGKLVGYLVANPNEEPMTVTLPEGAFEALWGAEGEFTGSLAVEGKTAVLLKVK